MVDELIKENRKLKRQVDRLAAGGTSAGTAIIERGLRGIQRRVQRAIGGSTGTRRRRSTGTRRRRTGTTTRRRRTTTTRRRTSAAGNTSS
jgi:hypothetical protein